MPRPNRIHRLPKHLNLDYTLIPAPEDLSLPSVTEKSPLPAIIVTPSSPSSTKDFSIAFLAPPKKPTLRQRVAEYWSPQLSRARAVSSNTGSEVPLRFELVSDKAEAHDDDDDVSLYAGYAAPWAPPITTASTGRCARWTESWRDWMSSVNPPIALPLTSPVSDSAPNSWHASSNGSTSSRGRRWMIVASIVFFLVLCHFFAHFLSLGAHVAGYGHGHGHSAAAAAAASSITDGPLDLTAAEHEQAWKVDWFSFDYAHHGKSAHASAQAHAQTQDQTQDRAHAHAHGHASVTQKHHAHEHGHGHGPDSAHLKPAHGAAHDQASGVRPTATGDFVAAAALRSAAARNEV